MAYKCEEEIRERAGRFIDALAAAGIEAAIVPGSARDYLIKVSICKAGRLYGQVNLYYSPKKSRYTLQSTELTDITVLPKVEGCWNHSAQAEGGDAPRASSAPGVAAYVDGSWIDGVVGYGVVILQEGKPVAEFSGRVEEALLLGMRQVGGELQSVHVALRWCQEHQIKQVVIHYDYEGIANWATGEWKANQPATRAYAEAIGNYGIAIAWEKVKAHNGDRWNERADQLAKLGTQQDAAEPVVDPIVALSGKATELVTLLAKQGIVANYQGMINNQAARVVLCDQPGTVDLYDSRKRPLSRPYMHGFRDSALQERIETVWKQYLAGDGEAPTPEADPLRDVVYYYDILKPYRDCAFDFGDLAMALNAAYERTRGSGIDVESKRYDFHRLEDLFFDLRGGLER